MAGGQGAFDRDSLASIGTTPRVAVFCVGLVYLYAGVKSNIASDIIFQRLALCLFWPRFDEEFRQFQCTLRQLQYPKYSYY